MSLPFEHAHKEPSSVSGVFRGSISLIKIIWQKFSQTCSNIAHESTCQSPKDLAMLRDFEVHTKDLSTEWQSSLETAWDVQSGEARGDAPKMEAISKQISIVSEMQGY